MRVIRLITCESCDLPLQVSDYGPAAHRTILMHVKSHYMGQDVEIECGDDDIYE